MSFSVLVSLHARQQFSEVIWIVVGTHPLSDGSFSLQSEVIRGRTSTAIMNIRLLLLICFLSD